jgi:hypothetical protein
MVSDVTCVIRDARAFAEIVAAAVAWSSEGLNQWAELKREWRVGQKREGAGMHLRLAAARVGGSSKLEMGGRGKDVVEMWPSSHVKQR